MRVFKDDDLIIAGKSIKNRLFIGTGKFSSALVLKECIENSKIEVVTVALRRVDFNGNEDETLSVIDRDRQILLPNTSGARNAEEAIRLARLARASGCGNWLKLEITPEPRYLLPDPIETLKAAQILVKEGFVVLPYINADPILAKRLEELGCATVMPLAAPIGTNKGIKTLELLQIIIEQSNIPVIVDAGLGSPSHACYAMELGADAVLVNTAIASSGDPVSMTHAFSVAVVSGRLAYTSGLANISNIAQASSPEIGVSF